MGTNTSNPILPEPKHYTILDYGYCKVWKRNDTSRQTMEQYHISIQNEEALNRFRNMWEFRMKDDHVVSVYYFTHQNTEELCGVYQKGIILIERIPYRLSQFCNIPYDEILLMIKMALQSYRQLHLEYGLFFVRSTMLCINHQNQLKIWHHTDLSQPLPQNSNCNSIFDMINSIIQAIQGNADMPVDYVRFSQFVKVNKNKINPGFDQMIDVLQTYKEMNRIPDYQGLPKLQYYLRKAEGWQQATFNSRFLSNLAQVDPQSSSLPRQVASRNSINSSKTMKNPTSTPRMNIYTHKEVNQAMERQNYLRQNLFANHNRRQQHQSNSSSSNRKVLLNTPARVNQRISYPSPQPQINSSHQSPIIKIVSKSPSEHTKIQFKIIPTIKSNNHAGQPQQRANIYHQNVQHPVSLSLGKPMYSNSSIEKRISLQGNPLVQKNPSLLTIPHNDSNIYQRRNRIQMPIQPKKSTLSRQSSLNLMESMRAQI